MIEAYLDTNKFEEKLKIFSSGLGNIYNELLKKIGKQMSDEASSLAPRKTGKMANSINFILYDDNKGALTTRKNIKKSNVWYSNIREHGADIEAKNSDYLIFKIDGEWKKVKSVKTKPQPFMRPIFDSYFGDNGKGFEALANELDKMMNEELK